MRIKFTKKTSDLVENRLLKENKLEELVSEINKILDSCIMKTTSEFDKDNSIKVMKKYMQKYDRLPYSVISKYIFSLNNEKQGIFITNLETLTEFVLSDEYKKKYLEKEEDNIYKKLYLEKEEDNIYKEDSIYKKLYLEKEDKVYKKLKKTILKLWDHSHLAIYQYENLKQSDDEFNKKFAICIEPVRNKMTEKISSSNKSIISQLISLVGIFTAMSFLVFGGINSLEEILKDAIYIPVLQAMIIGSIWGLFLTNLIFVFMFFVSKMTKLEIKSSDRKDANLVQKYPLVFWSELILVIILGNCSWLYYIDSKDIGYWFVLLGKNFPKLVSILGFFIILIVSLIMVVLILKNSKCDNNSNKENNKEYDQMKNKTIEKSNKS
ncbi:hypothetical protein [Clostridium sp. BJN0001]|uniref:hypothetical protein n=1 Tax=Clostridium sp. BJN0001 TaxID=2930219 RepID=UPI001FD43033|nr:hypothetical protein [Clostridium sp. BJN0001]